MHPLAKQADECRTLLGQQQFTAEVPGTILGDGEAMLAFIGEKGLLTKSQQGNLPAEVLPELNARLAAPIEIELKRPLLRDYPNLAGVFVLLRVMDLARVEGKRVRVAEENLARWRGLNPTEQYGALLEAWLLRGDGAVLGAEDRRGRRQFNDNVGFLLEFKRTHWRCFHEYFHLTTFGNAITTWNAQLQARFGLIEAEPLSLTERRDPGRGWKLGRARRTAWGTAVAWALAELMEKESESDAIFFHLPEDAAFGYLQRSLRRYLPAWEKTYGLAPAAARTGQYIFKASFADWRVTKDVWCRLGVPADDTLDELAEAVLAAFKFSDTEHLYEFRYRDHLGRGRVYNHPYTDEGPYASKITVGESDLPEKGTMKFRFDYGDDWRFELRLERIEPQKKNPKGIDLLESRGKPPPQYPDWEE